MASSDMNLDLIISAQDLASKEIKELQRELKRLTTETDGVGKASNGVFWSLKAWRLAVGAAVTWAIVAVWKFASEAIDVSISYESAFAGVRKTVDATEEEFEALNETLKDMETPTTFEELAHIMELGGQLGIAQENLAWFTETMDKLAVSTNLTSEEAATLWAQFANITWMDMKNIDRWGSTIVKLGNNMATTEADIVNFSSRIAAAWHSFWMSEADIMAIASTFTSLGVEAEMGWTAVSKVLNDMKTSIATSSPKVEKYAKLLGTTTKGFKEMMKNDPTWTFVKFNQALADSGENLNSVLASLWMKDLRLNDAFGRIAWNVDLLTNALDMANEGREENIALTNEASQRFATTESQIAIAQKERANTMAELWDSLKPIVLLWENVKTVALWFLADVLWPIASWIGERIQSFQEAGEGGKTMIESMKESFQSFKDWVSETFGPLAEAVKRFWDEHGEKVKAVIGVITDIVKTWISVGVDLFEWAVETVSWLIDFVTAIFKGDWDSAFNAVDGLLQSFSNTIKNVLDTVLWFFGTSLDEIYETISNVFDSIADTIAWAFKKAYDWIKSTFFDPVIEKINYIKSLWQSVMDFFWWSSETVGKSLQRGEHNVSKILASAKVDGAMATGWEVTAWSTYLVWERWPELFVPKTSGEIVPNNQITNNNDININMSWITVRSDSDIQSLADEIARRIKLEKNFWII